MLRQDNVFVGFFAGIACAAIFYIVFLEVNSILQRTLLEGTAGFSDQFIAIAAVCTTLFPFLMFNAADKARSMRGIIAATLVLAAVVIIFYRNEFF